MNHQNTFQKEGTPEAGGPRGHSTGLSGEKNLLRKSRTVGFSASGEQ